jgi:hypothetical protein
MKLSSQQIEKIVSYLNSLQLNFQEFYDEMLDHYCTAVENRMNQGESFDEARIAISHELAEDVYSPSKVGSSFYGPKAMEMRFLKNASNFKKDLSRTLNVIRSPWVVIWVLLIIIGYAGWKYDVVKWTSLGIWCVNISCLLFAGFKSLKLKDLPVWIMPKKRFSIEQIKSAKLKSVYSENRIAVFLLIVMAVSNFFDTGSHKQLYMLVVSLLFYPIPISYVLENRVKSI